MTLALKRSDKAILFAAILVGVATLVAALPRTEVSSYDQQMKDLAQARQLELELKETIVSLDKAIAAVREVTE